MPFDPNQKNQNQKGNVKQDQQRRPDAGRDQQSQNKWDQQKDKSKTTNQNIDRDKNR